MQRKKLILWGTAAFLLLVGAAGTLLWALLRVPDFYLAAASSVPQSPEDRQQAAKHLVQETTNLINNIKHADEWSAVFKETEVNSWFLEELHQKKYDDIVPEGVSDLRLVIQDNRLQLGFRFRKKGWTGIVSLHLKPWVQNENTMAVEIESIRAGIVPIPLEDMLQQLSKQLTDKGWNITWNHANGNDVAIIHLHPDKPDSPVLEELSIVDGQVRIRGHRRDFQPEPNSPNNYPRTAANR